tara:strand:+ start:142633 stop:143217 length:585 start_codon:yes stop_codon:yes gene_type:complete
MEQGTDNTTTLVPTSSGDSNAGLVAQFQAGEAEAFEELVTANHTWLMRLINRLIDSTVEGEDVLVAVFQGLPRFRQQSSFATWVTTIAVNKCRTHRRRSTRRKWFSAYLLRGGTLDSYETDDTSSDDAEEVRRAVRGLPEKYREPVVLHYFEHMNMVEVAGVLRLKTNTVEVRLSRARRLLRTVLNSRIDGDHE